MATKKKTATVHTKEEKTSTSQSPSTSGKRSVSKKSNASSDTGKKQTTAGSEKQNVRRKKASSDTKSKKSRRSEINIPDISRKKGTPLSAEIFLWLLLAFCIIFFLGNTFQAGGMFGRSISGFFFGLFGMMAYIMPFLLFLMMTLLIANHGSLQAWLKVIAALVLVISLSCFFALVSNPVSSQISLGEYYHSCMENKNGGGMAGAAVYQLFHPIVGEIGTWICNIILFIIGMILLTGHTLFDSIYSESGSVIGQAHTRKRMRRELNQQKRKRAQLQKQMQMQREIEEMKTVNQDLSKVIREPRRQRVVTGVSTNTTFDMGLPVAEEIHEVVPKIQKSSRAKTVMLDPANAKAAEESVPELPPRKEKIIQTKAERTAVVEMDAPKREESLPELQFTIQRNGSSQVISSASPASETVREVEPEVITFNNTVSRPEPFSMPEISKEDKSIQAEHKETVEMSDRTAEESVPELPPRKEKPKVIQTKAERTAVVETAAPKREESLPELQFTIQRNGSSQVISSASPASETVREVEPEVITFNDTVSRPAEEPIEEPTIKKETTTEEITAKTKIKNPHSTREEQEQAVDSVAEEIKQNESVEKAEYVFPPLDLLKKPSGVSGGNTNDEVAETARKLQDTLHSFGVNVTVTNVSCGPAVTRYELQPEQGVKVSKIVNLADDIKLNLAAEDIRIEAPIPGKAAVGIEVPNKENSAVYLRELLESDEFQNAKSNLSFAVGKDIAGKTVVTDIAKMPHLLIAGATGSGKSVCINTLIMSIIYKADPEDVKLIMIDPKVVELSVYNGIPHLFIPVVTDPKKASGALNWGVAEMTKRYELFAQTGVRDLKGYNAKVEALDDVDAPDKPKKLPQIVIIVDELADLMMVAPGEVEDAICRLAQLARAAGIHLIIATQRPSVNVITGLIKANMPSRIAFSVTSGVDSRTILDMTGAEKLLGKGDMLFYPQGYSKPVRVQGSFVSDAEVSKVTEFLTQKNDMTAYHRQMEARMNTVAQSSPSSMGAAGGSELDSNFVQAGKFIIEKDKASIGMLQRVFKIGFNRAARIMDQLSEAGVVGPEEGTKPRKVLMSMEEFEQYIDENV